MTSELAKKAKLIRHKDALICDLMDTIDELSAYAGELEGAIRTHYEHHNPPGRRWLLTRADRELYTHIGIDD